MSVLRFKSCEKSEKLCALENPNYTAQVSLLQEDVWRVLITHRPEDQDKTSWVIPPECHTATIPFEMTSEDNQVVLSAATAMTLSLSPFTFLWQGLQALGIHSEPVQTLYQQLPQAYKDLHLSYEHPVKDKLDGLPQGSGLTLDFDLLPEDLFYGLGERTGFLNKRGRRWHNWSSDQFFHSPQADPLYQSHPFVILAREGYFLGLYLDESWYSCFDLGCTHAEQWSIHTAGPTLDLYLIPGPTPAAIIERYTQLVGRPSMPPLWALGQHQCRWSYPEQGVAEAIASRYQKYALPLDALWLDIDYMHSYKVFSFSSHRFPEPERLIQNLSESGVKTVVIVDPGVKQESGYSIYETGKEIDAFVHNERDDDLIGEVWPSPVVWPDFTQPVVRSWWGKLHQFYLQCGIAGIWNDMNEPAAFKWESKTLPLNARHGAYSHAEVHNLYAYHMAQATFEGLSLLEPGKRPFVLTRSGCAGIQKFAWVWTGDNASYWEHLEMSIPMLLNLGLSGVPFIGADIGGFSGDCDGELLTAWSWLGVTYPLMRNHSGKRSRRQEPWQFGSHWLNLIRKALQFRYTLLPYLYTLSKMACQTGEPLMRALLLDYPEDPEVLGLSDQFLLGKDLLVAPIIRPAQTRRLVYLPEGIWYDFWTGKRFEGREWHHILVSLERLPLFQRAGSAIPLQETQLHTTTAFWPELIWQICPAVQICGAVYSDRGEGPVNGTWDYLEGHVSEQKLSLKREDTDRQVSLKLLGFDPEIHLDPFPGAEYQREFKL